MVNLHFQKGNGNSTLTKGNFCPANGEYLSSVDKSYELAKEYSEKFDTDRWDYLKGLCCKSKNWYGSALKWFKDYYEEYDEVKKIFEDYNKLEDSKKIINYYEKTLSKTSADCDEVRAISPDLTYKYVYALFEYYDDPTKAWKNWNEYKKDENRWYVLGGRIRRSEGKRKRKISMLEEAISLFQKANDKEKVNETKEMIRKIQAFEYELDDINDWYSNKEYSSIIDFVEKNEKIQENEEIVDKYLWSLWLLNDETKQKYWDIEEKYRNKFNTKRWYILNGHYFKWREDYPIALTWYEDISENDYNEVKRIFEDYNKLDNASEIIEYFEVKFSEDVYPNFDHRLVRAISPDLTYKYVHSLYSDGYEKKAMENWNKFTKDEDRWYDLGGEIKVFIGIRERNIDLVEDAITLFQKSNSKGEIEKAKEVIKKIQTLEYDIEEINELYSNGEYSRLIDFLEDKEKLKVNEEIIDKYLWSLWYNSGTEKKAWDAVNAYSEKFKTKRWSILKGHYCKWSKLYIDALGWYQDCSKNDYAEVLKIFEDYNNLDDDLQIIEHFEAHFTNINPDDSAIKTLSPDLTYKYVRSLYNHSGTERESLEKWNEYSKGEDRWKDLGGEIKIWVGRKDRNIDLVEEALDYYLKKNNKDKINSAKATIKDIQIAIKESEKADKEKEKQRIAEEKDQERQRQSAEKERQKQAAEREKKRQAEERERQKQTAEREKQKKAAEKEYERQAAAAEKVRGRQAAAANKAAAAGAKHSFVTLQDDTFCQKCGRSTYWGDSPCPGNHKYIYLRNSSGSWDKICEKCGRSDSWGDSSCPGNHKYAFLKTDSGSWDIICKKCGKGTYWGDSSCGS